MARGWSQAEQDAADAEQRRQAEQQGVQQSGDGGFTHREYNATTYGGGAVDARYDAANPGGVAVGPTSDQQELNRYRGLGETAANRQAYQVDFARAQADRANSLAARGQQMDALSLQRQAAEGNAPSRAAIMGEQAAGQSLGAALGASAGARGLGAAAAQAQAMRGQAGMQLGAVGQMAGLRSQEMNAARGQFSAGATGIRSGDYASQALSQQQAEAQAYAENAQRRLNQQGQMGYEQAGLNVEQSQLDASMRLASAQNAANETQKNEHDARNARAMKVYTGVSSAIGAVGGMSDERSKQSVRRLSFSDAHAKREAYMLGLKDGGAGGEQAAMARAWDQGHNEALTKVQEMRKMTPAELKALGERGNRLANAVRGAKGDAYDEARGAPQHIMQPLAPPRQMQSFTREEPAESMLPPGQELASNETASDERTKGDVVSLYEEPGTERHYDRDVPQAPPDVTSGASLSGPTPRYGTPARAPGLAAAAAARPRRMTDAELKRMADEMMATQRAGNEASLAAGPSVKDHDRDDDAMGRALADMQPYEYEYKPEFGGGEGQEPGEKNVGPMAQDMAKNPITGSAVIKRPDGMLAVDMTKAGKLSLGAIGYLAAKQREQADEIARLKKGGR